MLKEMYPSYPVNTDEPAGGEGGLGPIAAVSGLYHGPMIYSWGLCPVACAYAL